MKINSILKDNEILWGREYAASVSEKGALFVQTNRMVEVTIPTFNDNQLL